MLRESSLAREVTTGIPHVNVPNRSDSETCFLESLLFDMMVGQTVFAAAGGTFGRGTVD